MKQGERLVEDHPLHQDQISILRVLIGIMKDDPTIIDVYPITSEHAEIISALCSTVLDPESLDRYLEADAGSSPVPASGIRMPRASF